MAVLTESQINTIVDQLVPPRSGVIRANADNVTSGISRVIDNRGKTLTHGWAQRTAYNAGGGNVAVIGGIYMCNDNRCRTEGWSPVKSTATGDDCLSIGSAVSNSKWYVHGAAFDSTHDAIAPPKGEDANRAKVTFHIEHCYFRYIRDEAIENDASCRGKYNDILADNTWMFISMRNPKNDAGFPNMGYSELNRILVRLACQPDPRSDALKSGCGNSMGNGGKVFKSGIRTGSADYKNCLFLWEARSGGANSEVQSWRPGATYQNVYALYAPKGVPQPYFSPSTLPSAVTDLGVYDNAYEVWLRARDRWLVQHDCRPKDDYFGLTCRAGQNHSFPNMVAFPQNWNYSWGPRTGTDPGSTDPALPTLSNTLLQPRQVRVSWTSSAETGRTIRYNLRRNGSVVLNQADVLTYTDNDVVPQTNYSYTVEAVDTTTGQSSGQTTALQVTTPTEQVPDIPIPNLQATLIQARQVTLTWNNVAVSGQTLRYNVRRNGTLIAPNLTGLTHLDSGVLPQQTYQYTIEAVEPSTSRTSGQSPSLQVTTPGENIPNVAPSTPTNLRTTGVTLSSVSLAWNASTDTDGTVVRYNLRRDGVIIAQPTGLSYTDSNVTPGAFYSYDVQAVDDDGAPSARTGNLDVQMPLPPENQPPTVPSGLTAAGVTARQISLSWQESTDTDGEVVFYRLYRDGVVISQTVLLSKTDTAVQPSTTYRYAVEAVDDQDEPSGKSQEISVTTPAAPEPPTGMADPLLVERLLKLENQVIRLTELSGELMRLFQKATDLKENMFS